MSPRAPLRWPPAVRPGARVGIAALSGPVDPERLRSGVEELVRLGFEPVPARNVGSREGFLAGSDAERLDAFHELAADPSIEAVVFARGGYGVMRILPGIDWGLLARCPRAYVGYSDLTPFLAGVNRELGLVALHGPMIAGDFARGLDPSEVESFLGALRGEPVALPLGGATGGAAVRGALGGGCLSMLTATQGTPFAPDLDGSILFWEDVNEPLYRLDRMLTHLRLSGTLARVRGMVVGETLVSDADEIGKVALESMLESLSSEFGWPVGWGLPSGHGAPNRTLPLGVDAELDPVQGRLSFESEDRR